MLEKGLETKEKQDLKIRELNTQKRNLEEKIEKIKKEKKAFIEEIKKEAQKIEKLPSINEKIKQHVACILNNLQPMENSVFNSKIQQVQIKQNLFDKQINCKFSIVENLKTKPLGDFNIPKPKIRKAMNFEIDR
ncbi:hypothetical protein [Treponema pedis]|nr:hypothetical protein [Treponema pedis]